MWMQWKKFGWICEGLEFTGAAIAAAIAERAGNDGGGQDVQGLAEFGVRLCWEHERNELTPVRRKERRGV